MNRAPNLQKTEDARNAYVQVDGAVDYTGEQELTTPKTFKACPQTDTQAAPT